MAKRWCVNFDVEPVLRHGLAEEMWLMQYQYAHGGYEYQGNQDQIAPTSLNLRILPGIEVGDWFAAYLPRQTSRRQGRPPKGTFFAIGEVIEPRDRPRHRRAARHFDYVARTVREHSHSFLDGVVGYTDAPVLYEDFTDPWRCPEEQRAENQLSEWLYPQRIDVREWEAVVPSGVQVPGVAAAAPFPAYRQAAFEIPEEFFVTIATVLRNPGRFGDR
jgi:hypothetical protein